MQEFRPQDWHPGGVHKHLQHTNYFSSHCTFFYLGGTQGPQISLPWGLICPCGTTIYDSYCHPHAKSLQSYPTLCNPMDCSLPGSSVHGSFGARIVEWVAMPSSNYHSQLVTKLWNIRQRSRIHNFILHLFPLKTWHFHTPSAWRRQDSNLHTFLSIKGLFLPNLTAAARTLRFAEIFVVLFKWWHLTNATGWFALLFCSYRNVLQSSQTLAACACLAALWPAMLTAHPWARGETAGHPAPGTICLTSLLHHLGTTTFKEEYKRGFLERNKVDLCSFYYWKPIQYIQWLETSEKSTQLGTFSFVRGKFSRWIDFFKKTGCSQISEKIVPSKRKTIICIYVIKYNQIFYFQPVEIKCIHPGHILYKYQYR